MADKKYYTIGEVEKICGVTQRMLRYYEKQDLVVPDKINRTIIIDITPVKPCGGFREFVI